MDRPEGRSLEGTSESRATTVRQSFDTERTEGERYRVGELRWKGPQEYQSIKYSQTGFELKNTSGREQTVLSLSKIGDIPLVYHREIPGDATIKEVIVKQEPTGESFAILGIETEDRTPSKPDIPEKCIGIDIEIMKYTHDTDGWEVGSLDLSDERARLKREQRALSRKEHGSNNWEEQRREVAKCHAEIKRKRRDFLHKLSNHYARKYDLVAVEDLNTASMMELPSNSRNRASAAWGTFLRMLEYKCEREGAYFIPVEAADTTKECANCGVATEKPLWVREHSCPACGFATDRDLNAAYNILSRGITNAELGSGTLRRHACGDCAPCGNIRSCKARHRSRKP